MPWSTSQIRRLLVPGAAHIALFASVALALLGIAAIGTVEPGYAQQQVRWLVIASFGLLVCTVPHPRQIGMASYPLMALGMALLLFLLLPGVPSWLVPVRNGARCWINLQIMHFQPSELAKIAYVLAMAWYLSHTDDYRTIRGLCLPFAMMVPPVVLLLAEPDLGTALLFPPMLMAMLLAAGARLRHLGTLVALGIAAVALNIAIIYVMPEDAQVLKPHQQDRIKAMVSQVLGDKRYIRTIGYQQYKAMTLIGAGGVTGYGEERAATMIEFNKLPERHNDMIFVVIINRWGLVGGLVTLGLFTALLLSFLSIAARSKDPFGRLIVVGFAALFFTQLVINVGMNIGLLPITGLTLPMISYGGSSLLACFMIVGLVTNVASRPPVPMARPSFEFDRPLRREGIGLR